MNQTHNLPVMTTKVVVSIPAGSSEIFPKNFHCVLIVYNFHSTVHSVCQLSRIHVHVESGSININQLFL